MSNARKRTQNPDDLLSLLPDYLKTAVQLLTALAGLTGLFYALGFLFVNLRLLNLGLFESGLVKVGYLVPGLAFGLICLMVLLWTVLVFDICERVFARQPWAVWLVGILGVSAGTWLLAYSLWFWRSISLPVALWLNGLGIVIALISRAAHESPQTEEAVPEEMVPRITQRARQSLQGAYAAVNLLVAIVAVLTYGYFIYPEIPPVFGGGQPIVVRFFGEEVGQLTELGIDLEPGETLLTRRVELISQTADRYIVRLGNRAVTFDKDFVQGLRSEPPEFFLDDTAFLLNHVTRGEQFMEDEEYDFALSEFNRALSRKRDHPPGLQGRAEIYMLQEQYDLAREDYQYLTEIEPENGDHHYNYALALVLQAQAVSGEIPLDPLLSALESAFTADSALNEKARGEAAFDPLRGDREKFQAFDQLVYGSGPEAARWFRQQAGHLAESDQSEQAIAAYQTAILYAQAYLADEGALGTEEIIQVYSNLKTLHLQLDNREQAIATLNQALALPALTPAQKADLYVDLSAIYQETDPLSDEALTALQNAVDSTAEQDSTYLNLLGDLHRERGEKDEALAVYAKATQALTSASDAEKRLAWIGQGRAHLESENYLAARADFESALALSNYADPEATLWYDYARVLAALADPNTAAALREAIDLDLELAESAGTTDWIPYFSKAGTSVENLIQGGRSFKQARDLRDQGDLQAAILAYQQAKDQEPGVFLYWKELGDALKQAGREAEAITAYQAALQRTDPETETPVDLLTSLAALQLSTGDASGAIESLTQAINLGADGAPASIYALLARAHEAQGSYNLAAEAYKQAALAEPGNPQYAYNAGIDWLLFGDRERGLASLSAVLAQGWLRVEAAEGASLREGASRTSTEAQTLGIGAQLRIAGDPLVVDGSVWWPVSDRGGNQGWVRASSLVPSLPPEAESSSATE